MAEHDLNASAPHNKTNTDDSILLNVHQHQLEIKKQSQQTNIDPYTNLNKDMDSNQSLRSKLTDQKVKLLSNLYQCSDIDQ